jgi:hypothetical protein
MQISGNDDIPWFKEAASRSSLQLCAILLYAMFLTSPLLLRGVASGYDAATHARYQHHFSRQFWGGEPYPRWLANENKGYGSPIFLIQYPLPYMVTALLRPLTAFPADADREARELGVFIFIALACAGAAAWLWFKEIAPPTSATLAALVYISLPYFMVGIYLRAALGELCALIWMPLLLALAERMHKQNSAVFAAAAAFALMIASNVIVTLLFVPMLAVYALFTGKEQGVTRRKSAWQLSLALLLGCGMAALYLLPAIAYRGLFDIEALAQTMPDFERGRFFLYFASGAIAHRMQFAVAASVSLALAAGWHIARSPARRSAKLTMWVVLALAALTLIPGFGQRVISLNFKVTSFEPYANFILVLLLSFSCTMSLGIIAYCRLAAARYSRECLLLLIACAAFLLMLPFAAPLWRVFPALKFVQFPFRLGSILTVSVAGLIALALGRHLEAKPSRPLPYPLFSLGVAVLCVIGTGMLTCWIDEIFLGLRRSVQYRASQDLDVMYRTYVAAPQLLAFAGKVGTDPASYTVMPAPGDGLFRASLTGGAGKVEVVRQSPRCLLISADCRGRALLDVSQLYSPLWKIIPVSGAAAGAAPGVSREGLLQIPLAAGKQKLQLVFDGGAAERWGLRISIASLLLAVTGYGCLARRSKASSP